MRGVFRFCGELYHFRKHAEREKAGAKGEIDSRGNQNQDEKGKPQRASARQGDGNQVAPEYVVNGMKDGQGKVFYSFKKFMTNILSSM